MEQERDVGLHAFVASGSGAAENVGVVEFHAPGIGAFGDGDDAVGAFAEGDEFFGSVGGEADAREWIVD
jgi:hypothetical protein